MTVTRLGEDPLVVPIAHILPGAPELVVEPPARVKRRWGLDEARSWIILSVWNELVRPRPDLRRVPGRDDGSAATGGLPPALFAGIRDRFADLVRRREARSVSRD